MQITDDIYRIAAITYCRATGSDAHRVIYHNNGEGMEPFGEAWEAALHYGLRAALDIAFAAYRPASQILCSRYEDGGPNLIWRDGDEIVDVGFNADGAFVGFVRLAGRVAKVQVPASSAPPATAEVEEVCKRLDADATIAAENAADWRRRLPPDGAGPAARADALVADFAEAASLLRSLSTALATVTAERDEARKQASYIGAREAGVARAAKYKVKCVESELTDALARAEAAEATVRECVEALRPFAQAAGNFDRVRIGDPSHWYAYGGINDSSQPDGPIGAITVSDLRTASALLSSIAEEPAHG